MANSQKFYDSAWQKVEVFQKQGLPLSAKEEVLKIYAQSKKEGNQAQLIKALVYQCNLSVNLKEHYQVTNIQFLEAEAQNASEPAKSILYSLTADLYWSYFQNQRWKIYNRTNTVNFKKDDIETWTITDFHQKIGQLFLLSIQNENALKQVSLDQYEPIIISGNTRKLRPTLFDLLAHRALDYFKNDERDIARPSYAFEIEQDAALYDAKEFSQFNFTTKDSANLHFKALQIFQRLISFHLPDNKKAALIDCDIERILFVNNYGIMLQKNELYKNSLEHIYKTYNDEEEAMQAGYLLASWYQTKGYNYKSSKNPEDKISFQKALSICDEIIKKFPNSEAGINCHNLRLGITKMELSMKTEKVNVPNQPFRTFVSFRNTDNMYLRVIKLTDVLKKQLDKALDEGDDKYWKVLTKAKQEKEWMQSLPATQDHQYHSCEVPVQGLPIGEYILLSSANKLFNLNKNPLMASKFYVSSISYVNSGRDVFVLDRESGTPLADASVQVWRTYYNYSKRDYIYSKKELLQTNKNGYVKLSKKRDEENETKLEISWKNDYLYLDDDIDTYERDYYNDEEDNRKQFLSKGKKDIQGFEYNHSKFFIFTDRSIYRPGQLLYFKAIGITKDFDSFKPKIFAPNDSVQVVLYDANHQAVDTLHLKTNEYGSIWGNFRLPENRLNGQFQIMINSSYKSTQTISVEEYKRPKFYVEFENVKGTYQVNDKIKVIGTAKAYAGNNIDGAIVKYRVVRTPRFIYPWLSWRYNYSNVKSQEITHGEATTDQNGNFTIVFEALPDKSINPATDPVFDYSIQADVTDINGETHSSSTITHVGYKSLELTVSSSMGQTLPIDSLNKLFINSKNLNGEFEPVKTDIKIYSLQTPNRLLRSRYWEEPDTTVLDYQNYIKLFPNDIYKDEDDYRTWKKNKLVLNDTFTTTDDPNSFYPVRSKFEQGQYLVEVSANDRFGKKVTAISLLQLYDLNKNSLPSLQYNWSNIPENTVEPGEQAHIMAGSSASNLFVIQQTSKAINRNWENTNKNKETVSSEFKFFDINNQKKVYDFSISEDDRGGFAVSQFFVKHNRFYSNNWDIYVPWSNKELQIKFDTYRDKVEPGSQEKWRVKISGTKGEKKTAEMLATMYDESLDQFKPHSWYMSVWNSNYLYHSWQSDNCFAEQSSENRSTTNDFKTPIYKTYDQLIELLGGYYNLRSNYAYPSYRMAGDVGIDRSPSRFYKKRGVNTKNVGFSAAPVTQEVSDGIFSGEKDEEKAKEPKQAIDDQSINGIKNIESINIRKNFNETAFFIPDLITDDSGNISFSFTMPEALTKWKLMALAHTKDLSSGNNQISTVTQKQLMVQPNQPRFLREGDELELNTKIVNMSDTDITGLVTLQLLDAASMQPIDDLFKNKLPKQNFTISAKQSAVVKFPVTIPLNFNNAIVYRIIAQSNQFSDGEEAALPVLTNRMLVTESLPIHIKQGEDKKYNFTKLLQSGNSKTLSNHKLTVEFTSNPAWYAVQALPYLMEYPYECAEQTFNRFYANALATHIINKLPKIKAVFEKWQTTDTAALMSNLQKNEELKSVLLEETPWVMDAKNEAQQKRNIALLFNMSRMSKELTRSLEKLKQMQSSNGGFVWFKGGPDDRYMTQYIITGIGHLMNLKALSQNIANQLQDILNRGIPYLDNRIREDYEELLRYKVDLKLNNTGYTQIQYLYMRSFFTEVPVLDNCKTSFEYYKNQAQQFWLQNGKYMQGMIALALHRFGSTKTPLNILASLKENAIVNEELGMYWKEFDYSGYYWYQAPIESQALLIEAFSTIGNYDNEVANLKTWLLKNKQTQNWKTTKATAEACYALLLQGDNWAADENTVNIKLGETIISSQNEKQVEAGTGYFKEIYSAEKINSSMGNISVSFKPIKNAHPTRPSIGWGAVYWQYFEDLDKITPAKTPLSLIKKLFIEKNTDNGPVLTPVNEETILHIGDKIKVRIELRVDRDMEYVHMKDMRGACMEPTNVISQYKYQDALGYYESTKDASTNFFFGQLYKGTYVFEYPLMVTHSGNFSNGVTTIQCMYAPEFTSHSEGIRINVK